MTDFSDNGTPIPGTLRAVADPPPPGPREYEIQAANLLKLVNGSKRNKVLGAALVLLLGSGGIVASYFATEALAKRNANDIEDNSTRIEEVHEKVSDIEDDVDDISKSQVIIVEGIESLKREKVEDLKKELEDERRRNRRRDRDRPPR